MQHLRRHQHRPGRALVDIPGLREAQPASAVCWREHQEPGLFAVELQPPGHHLLVQPEAPVGAPRQVQCPVAFGNIGGGGGPEPERQGGEAHELVVGVLGFEVVLVNTVCTTNLVKIILRETINVWLISRCVVNFSSKTFKIMQSHTHTSVDILSANARKAYQMIIIAKSVK